MKMRSNIDQQVHFHVNGITEEDEMVNFDEFKKFNCTKALDSLGNFGLPWKKGHRYDGVHFHCGTPDNIWLYVSSPGLDIINKMIQVILNSF